MARVRASPSLVHTVVCDLSASPIMDLAGAEMMKHLEQELRESGARLRIVEARAAVRDRLRAEGLEGWARRVDRFTTVADAVDATLAEHNDIPGTEGQR